MIRLTTRRAPLPSLFNSQQPDNNQTYPDGELHRASCVLRPVHPQTESPETCEIDALLQQETRHAQQRRREAVSQPPDGTDPRGGVPLQPTASRDERGEVVRTRDGMERAAEYSPRRQLKGGYGGERRGRKRRGRERLGMQLRGFFSSMYVMR